MKKIAISFLLIFFILPTYKTDAKFYSKEEIKNIMSLVVSSAVVTTTKEKAFLYSKPVVNSNIICSLNGGEEIEILKDKSMLWYRVKAKDKEGWIKSDYIIIPEDYETNAISMKKDEIEGFVNLMDFESNTRYFVWTDIDRQVTHIFIGKRNNWELQKTLDCSTGKNISPTIRGLFMLKERGLWFYSERLKSGGKYWVRIDGSYLFHSVAMDRDKNIIDPIISKRRSNGCVRFNVSDAKWFYENVPDRSSVFIY